MTVPPESATSAPQSQARPSSASSTEPAGLFDYDDHTGPIATGSGRPPTPPRRPTSSAWWRYGFPAALVLLIVAIPALVFAGSRVLLNSSDGTVIRSITDPAAPGWEAAVDPTPVRALAVTDGNGTLDHVVVQTLTGEASGGIIVVPANTAQDTKSYGKIPLSRSYTDGQAEAVRLSLEQILGVGIGEIQIIEPTEWDSLVGPVAPITVNNVDAVSGSDSQGLPVSFPQGSLQVEADEVWPYLSTSNADDSEENRMLRVEAFWRGWLNSIAAAPDTATAVPGELDSGLGFYVRSLAKDSFQVVTLPVAPTTGPEGQAWFDPLPDAVEPLVASLVPFPAGPANLRVRIKVLDGTGSLDHGLDAAVLMAADGAQIDKIGNAVEFGVPVTQFVYYDEALKPKVQALRDALGAGELVRSEEINVSADATVVLGEDYLALVGPSETSSEAITSSIVPSSGGSGD